MSENASGWLEVSENDLFDAGRRFENSPAWQVTWSGNQSLPSDDE